MRALLLVALLVAACKIEDKDRAPTVPGGPSGTGSGANIDAREDDGDGGAAIVGRVCLVTDLRQPATDCANTGAGDLTVTLGSKTTTTVEDGTFSIEPPSGSNLTWRVTGADIVTSVTPFSVDTVIPTIDTDVYTDLLSTNGVILIAGQGSVVGRVVQGAGAGRAGADPARGRVRDALRRQLGVDLGHRRHRRVRCRLDPRRRDRCGHGNGDAGERQRTEHGGSRRGSSDHVHHDRVSLRAGTHTSDASLRR
jgi:hypothetical protein